MDMSELNASIRDIEVPDRLRRRPINERGFPVPWFVSMREGKWDFVNIDPGKVLEAYRRKICFLCGEPLGQYFAFVIGPMCSINRVSAEPPTHRECSEYAVRVCPFLVRPSARRNEKAQVGSAEDQRGIMIEHNPGVCLIWITKSFRPEQGIFRLGDPVDHAWYAQGRGATRAEIDAAIAKGLPLLYEAAGLERGGVRELEQCIARAGKLLPPPQEADDARSI